MSVQSRALEKNSLFQVFNLLNSTDNQLRIQHLCVPNDTCVQSDQFKVLSLK